VADKPRKLPDNWREEWLADDRDRRREDWRDVAAEGTRFFARFWLWSLVSGVVLLVLIMLAAVVAETVG
jgi:hypothetical protein